ncbi:uncharacterized protein L969DRAFT_90519 [Mixia osmundae IAM 14324]|uniref:uncharacterized protein n=1 Tax=Mixia osmundae (strain CBS 9802 / IAM 14324 / JCM 22182 / KY 12970) TaxID=764103 RepID=UPI0004A552F6|nr:uncharacterized protein L969DRAFT_90519 [Mixia osmundae IAM 14324]KEI36963.1 hypothetical protein L969DRAFT_90519 [Mixia osmundae IAM 14324]
MTSEPEDTPTYKAQTISQIFQSAIDSDARMKSSTVTLSTEYLRLLAVELFHAAKDKARQDSAAGGSIKPEHLEVVLAGVLLDF